MMKRSSRADLGEDPVGELGARLHVADDHQLDVEQLIDVLADPARDVADDLGQLALHPLVDSRAHAWRQVAPQLRVFALHGAVDETVDVRLRRGHDVLGDELRVEPLVEVGGRAELCDALVDGDRAHLRGARRDDPLPAKAAVHDARDLLDLARQDAGERGQPRDPDADEAQRLEQHPDAAPVRHVADRPREQRDRDEPQRLHRLKCYVR
jgi:hypothetical protein